MFNLPSGIPAGVVRALVGSDLTAVHRLAATCTTGRELTAEVLAGYSLEQRLVMAMLWHTNAIYGMLCDGDGRLFDEERWAAIEAYARHAEESSSALIESLPDAAAPPPGDEAFDDFSCDFGCCATVGSYSDRYPVEPHRQQYRYDVDEHYSWKRVSVEYYLGRRSWLAELGWDVMHGPNCYVTVGKFCGVDFDTRPFWDLLGHSRGGSAITWKWDVFPRVKDLRDTNPWIMAELPLAQAALRDILQHCGALRSRTTDTTEVQIDVAVDVDTDDPEYVFGHESLRKVQLKEFMQLPPEYEPFVVQQPTA